MTSARLFLPTSADEAIELLGRHGSDLLLMGGGTVVMHLINEGKIFPKLAMHLHRAGLGDIRPSDGQVEIGATATVARLVALDSLPLLAEAAAAFGGPALRTMATIGGNLFVPPPAGDLAVPLLALDAEVDVATPDARQWQPLDAFLARPNRSGLVTRLRVPLVAGATVYRRFGRRRANTPAIVAVAVRIETDDGICTAARIALGAAAPYPMRARAAEAVLLGQHLDETSITAAAEAATRECDPITDALASAWYRRRMVGVFVRRALISLTPGEVGHAEQGRGGAVTR